MALADLLTELSARTKRLEEEAEAVRSKSVARLQEQRAKLQSAMDDRKKAAQVKAAETKAGAQGWWAGVTVEVERRRVEMAAKRKEFEAEKNIAAAKRYAEATEDQAEMLTELAGETTDAAAEAVLDAAIAKAHYEALEAQGTKVTA